MSTAANDFLSKLLATFRLEADEHLRGMTTALLALDNATTAEERQPLLETVFRAAHSLKGAARTVDLMEVEMISQSIESIFTRLKRGDFPLSTEGVDAVRSALGAVEALLNAPQEAHATRVSDAVQRLTAIERTAHQHSVSPVPVPVAPAPASPKMTPVAPLTPPRQEPPPPPAPAPVPTDFMQTLLLAFQSEADEHLRSMATGLLALEKATTAEERQPLLENVFREAHSLKGAARAVDVLDIEMICQTVEGIFAQLKRGERLLSAEGFDAVHAALDTIAALLRAPHEPHATQVADAVQRLTAITQQPQGGEEALRTPPALPPTPRAEPPSPALPANDHTTKPRALGPPSQPLESASTPKPTSGETIRVSTEKLKSLFLQAEEMITVKLSVDQHAANLREMMTLVSEWKKEWARISSEVRKLQRAIEDQAHKGLHSTSYLQSAPTLVEFLYWNERQLNTLESQVHGLANVIESDQQTIGTLVDNLLEDTKRVLMFPFSSLLDIFPKMVRDLSRALGKEVELTLRGGEVEIDKRILEELKTPLIHLLRNSLDHGIEPPEARVRQGKLGCGSLQITVTQTGGSTVEIVVSDDGAGIDADMVKQAVVKKGLLTAQAADALDEHAAIDLIFHSDVTTSPIVTDLSGRGLGMAIVREKVENLGGHIQVETHRHQGTTFRIVLSLTLATFRSVFVRAADSIFAVPTTQIERVIRLEPHEITTLEGKQTVLVDDQPLAFVSLDEILQLPRRGQPDARTTTARVALILGTAKTRVACGVDDVLHEQETLVKRLGPYLSQVPNVVGATVLGSGHVVPILHIPDLLKSITAGAHAYGGKRSASDIAETVTKSVLLAEDSITSRMLLKGILESAGYRVTTAVDGLDALTTCQKTTFDLIVSDVEMPRMNGFELTTKIRETFGAHLPVVLVTGLDSRQDRERGIAAGADAYIVKTNFDQSNLLDVVQRLL